MITKEWLGGEDGGVMVGWSVTLKNHGKGEACSVAEAIVLSQRHRVAM